MLLCDDEELFKEVNDRARKNPELIGRLLEISSALWKEHVSYLENKRKSEHVRAICDVMHCLSFRSHRFTEMHTTILIDPIKFAYPHGYRSTSCEADRDVLDKFIAAAIERWQPDDDFMHVREMSDYLKMLYEQNPAISKCANCNRYVDLKTHDCGETTEQGDK